MTKTWWRFLWFGWVLVIGAVTTLPWSNFVGHSHWSSVRWVPFQDASLSYDYFVDCFANVLLFVPFGYLQRRAGFVLARRKLLSTAMAAWGLSTGAELVQVYMHGRFASATDVLCNVAGAIIGGLA